MNEFEARIIESYGRRTLIETASGERKSAVLFGKRLQVVCGDKVTIRETRTSDELQVVQLQPRRSLFSRTDNRGRSEPLAANLTRLAVIVSVEPACDLFIVDRYLAGAAYAGVGGSVWVNKADLLMDKEFIDATEEFRRAGFSIFRVSAHTGEGVDVLLETLKDETTLLVGQSGVGKSTLTNLLVPETLRPTQTLSSASGEGRHTTVSAALYRIPGGGELIDSPGVRDYAPAPTSELHVQNGWPEIVSLAVQCKFSNCLHLREPACAVRAALEAGAISARRYESYKRLMNLMRQLVPSYERPK